MVKSEDHINYRLNGIDERLNELELALYKGNDSNIKSDLALLKSNVDDLRDYFRGIDDKLDNLSLIKHRCDQIEKWQFNFDLQEQHFKRLKSRTLLATFGAIFMTLFSNAVTYFVSKSN